MGALSYNPCVIGRFHCPAVNTTGVKKCPYNSSRRLSSRVHESNLNCLANSAIDKLDREFYPLGEFPYLFSPISFHFTIVCVCVGGGLMRVGGCVCVVHLATLPLHK